MSERPLLLDLFCGAGGASAGYERAGFAVEGRDVVEQPNYPGDFFRQEAFHCLRVHSIMRDFGGVDVIHASPPCQAYTQARRLRGNRHPDLIPELREALIETGLPYVIENVPGAPLRDYVQVCGRGLGLAVKRHRWFESNLPLMGAPCVPHEPYLTVYGHTVEWRNNDGWRRYGTVAEAKKAMETPWMTREEMREAIPPAYTEFLGRQILEQLEPVPASGLLGKERD